VNSTQLPVIRWLEVCEGAILKMIILSLAPTPTTHKPSRLLMIENVFQVGPEVNE
jgi:hypothetical protein